MLIVFVRCGKAKWADIFEITPFINDPIMHWMYWIVNLMSDYYSYGLLGIIFKQFLVQKNDNTFASYIFVMFK